jgi:hypothetical protein
VADTALILGLAGISGTVVVGVASPWIAAHFAGKQQERTFEHERTMRDAEELRAVLDDVAACLDACDEAMHAAFGRFIRWGRRIAEEEDGREKLERLGGPIQRLDRGTGRLAVRLGEHHPVKRAADEAQRAVRTFTDAIVNVAFMAEQADPTRERAEMERGRGDFGRARSAFVEAASAYAGSRLPNTN